MLPFDLRKLLERCGNRKTKRISLELFPHNDENEIVRIFVDFIKNRDRQSKRLPDIRSIQDLENCKMEIENFEFSIPQFGLKNTDELFSEFFARPIYLYIKPQNIETSFVVDKIRPEILMICQHKQVIVNKEILYSQVDEIRQVGKDKYLKIGTDTTIHTKEDKWTINFSFKGSLHEQIREMKMLLALAQGQEIRIGNMLLSNGNMNLRGKSLYEFKSRLSDLLLIDAALKKLHVKKDLDLGNLSQKDFISLNCLVKGIMHNIPVPLDFDGNTGIGTLSIGNIKVAINAVKNPDSDGFIISDFYAENLVLPKNGESSENMYVISPYLLMNCSSFTEYDNADLSQVVPSILKCPFSEVYAEYTNRFVLELISLYDNTGEGQALEVASKLLSHLQSHDKRCEDIYRINQIQIEKRRRKLSDEEIRYLVSLKTPDSPLQYQLSANILLESFAEANLTYEKLTDDDRKIFNALPIKRLWKE